MSRVRLARALLVEPQQSSHRERHKRTQTDERRVGHQMVAVGEWSRERVHPIRYGVRVHIGAHLHGLQVVPARRHDIRKVKRLRHQLATHRLLCLQLRRVLSARAQAQRVPQHARMREQVLATRWHVG